MSDYSLQIPEKIARQVSRARTTVRAAIQDRLNEIAHAASKPSAPRTQPGTQGPPLRFYVFEGFQVRYEIDPLTRSVSVLELVNVPA